MLPSSFHDLTRTCQDLTAILQDLSMILQELAKILEELLLSSCKNLSLILHCKNLTRSYYHQCKDISMYDYSYSYCFNTSNGLFCWQNVQLIKQYESLIRCLHRITGPNHSSNHAIPVVYL